MGRLEEHEYLRPHLVPVATTFSSFKLFPESVMSKARMKLYLDLQSPYSYLAFSFIRKSPSFQTCDKDYVPVLLIGFVKAGVGTPPWSSSNKVRYLEKDLARWAEQLKIPWRPGHPAYYPNTSTSNVQRAAVACSLECPDKLGDVLDALYYAFWFRKRGVQLDEVYESILRSILGESLSDKVVRRSESEEVKALLRKNTQEALDDGACGLPWFSVINSAGEQDVFWGFDHIGQVTRFLGLEKIRSAHL
ncbi:thioredoxin-like protein [Viridothelium virens]|uniref:Glutathione S-transferase kappa n=1 Tax=Viridothelium virens TaxID=1048519 RepID=A0A6A6HDU1_VIRVR|nr:thioredoxin-like protein [Viridothelium virens]